MTSVLIYITAFPMAVFIIYGCHWGSLAYTQDPNNNQLSAFEKVGSSAGAEWAASQGFHNVTMVLVSFVFLVATFRVNAFFVATFFGLVMMFSFIAAANFAIPSIKTAADLEHVGLLLKIGGGFGWLGLISGWYLAILTACAAVGIPCPLPVLDLSSKVFSKNSSEHPKDA
jgi:succinate-acetate transporter protein